MADESPRLENDLARIRGMRDMTQQQLADAIGASVQAYQNYEYGKRDMKGTVLTKLADVLDCSVNEILGLKPPRTAQVESSDTWCPHLGVIAAGSPKEAIEQVDERSWCPPGLLEKYPHVFTLTASGDSMNLLYPDGRLIYVDPDDTEIENDKQYAVLVNGFDSTVKTLFKKWDTVILHPESTNPVHKDMVIDQSDPDAPYFRVVGKVVWDAAPMKW